MDLTPSPLPATVPAAADDTLRIASVNWQYGGLDPDGTDERWRQTVDVLGEVGAHVVLCQEFGVPQPALQLSRHVRRTANALGMEAVLGPVPPGARSALHSAILVDTRTIGLRIETEVPYTHSRFGGTQHESWCGVRLRLPGLEDPDQVLDCYSVHLPARSAVEQLSQAQTLAALLTAPERLVLAGGDFNGYPRGGPAVTADELERLPPHLRVTRCRDGADGRLEANYDVDDVFARARLFDLAYSLPAELRHPPELRATGRGGARVDRAYASPELATAATGYWQVPIGSDHDGLVFDVNLAALRQVISSRAGGGR
ncbi:endonuclease/exonuclease/phosphatase family protein [Actinomadura chibensis]|uniref:Endonuclease/exonuclease/phosphatase domain-containing protein n=1 Tax=Actinomadura chibensis TaxID=392828 RepID=A0A5D0NU02_9ACTN|nr:endonuclease/exonuclease/phosphatase family protein [Actinomadura chibensis]TYB47809.1 hypothetical protein FXF69_00695 [Actinomadura chibensis]